MRIVYTHRKGELAAARRRRARNPAYIEAKRLDRIASSWQFDAALAAHGQPATLRKHSGSERAGETGTTQEITSPPDRRSSRVQPNVAAAGGGRTPKPASSPNRGPIPPG